MKFFLDSANIEEIAYLNDIGLVDGVTTNPSIIAKSGRPIEEVIRDICNIIDGDVSAEVVATDYEGMLNEGKKLAKIAENVVVKLPLTEAGIKACRYFSDNDVAVNMTLCFNAMQALLAAKAGACYISPFVGRLDDISHDGLLLIRDISLIYSNYSEINTEILVASVRNPLHILESAKLGADVATMPPTLMRRLINHPLTDKGLELFLKDWEDARKGL